MSNRTKFSSPHIAKRNKLDYGKDVTLVLITKCSEVYYLSRDCAVGTYTFMR